MHVAMLPCGTLTTAGPASSASSTSSEKKPRAYYAASKTSQAIASDTEEIGVKGRI